MYPDKNTFLFRPQIIILFVSHKVACLYLYSFIINNTFTMRQLLTTILLCHFLCLIYGQELSENNASEWGVFDQSGLTNTVSNNTTLVQEGSFSIQFNTNSGFDTGLFYPKARNANFNLANSSLSFFLYASNPSPNGFQDPLTVRLYSSNTDYYDYVLSTNIPLDSWANFEIPLNATDPCNLWTRTQTGNPSISNIQAIEFRFDTFDFGFEAFLDGVKTQTYTPPQPLNQNEYVELQNLMVVLRDHNNVALTDPLSDIEALADEVSSFYWRHSKQSLNIKWDYLEFPQALNVFQAGTDVIDPITIEALLLSNGISNDQYDAVIVTASSIGNFGWTSGANQLLGKSGFGQFGWNGIFLDDVWDLVHEFNHTLDGIMQSAGFSAYPHNHPATAFSLGEFVPPSGPNFDLNAQILQSITKAEWAFLVNCGVWGVKKSFTDSDRDGFADNDLNVPLDELRFGSSASLIDTDNDDLSDLDETIAGTFLTSDPFACDSDGDALRDGLDAETLYPLKTAIDYRPVPLGSTNFFDYTLLGDQAGTRVYANFDETRLFLAIENNPFAGGDFSISFDLKGDGLFYSRDNVRLVFQGNVLTAAELHDESQIPIISSLPINIFSATVLNNGSNVFIQLPESSSYEFTGVDGERVGIRIIGDSNYQTSFFDLDDYAQFILCGSGDIDNRQEATCAAVDASCPFITCPPSESILCSADAMPGTVAIDTLCSIDDHIIDISGPVVLGDPDCPGTTYTFTFIVSDLCNNIDTCIQVLTIQNDAPQFDACPADQSVTCNSDIDPVPPGFTTSCGNGNLVTDGPVIDGDPDCPGTTYTYTYTLTDNCGRSDVCIQVFTIGTGADPVIDFCPGNQTVDCVDDISEGVPTFTTTCGVGGSYEVSELVRDGDENCPSTTYTYTYTITDACGRISTCDQVFTINLGDEPDITSCTANETVLCPEDIMLKPVSYTTSCGVGATIDTSLLVTSINGNVNCAGTSYEYTFTITDDCGRVSLCVQTFLIDDGVDPVITNCPMVKTVDCAADILLEEPDFTTTCGVDGSVVTSGPVITGDENCPGTTYTYTYVISDDCGRNSTCEQVFVIDSGGDPVITNCPMDQMVDCALDILPVEPSFTTTCGVDGSVMTTGPEITGDLDCPGTTYEYTYTVTDACDRVSICLQTFTIAAGSDPVITTCPANEMVECASEITLSDPIFDTDCGVTGQVTTVGPTIAGDPNCPGTVYTYTYIVTDDCGRTNSCTQDFTISASNGPIIDCVDHISVSCETEIVVPFVSYVTSCGQEATVTKTGPVIDGDPSCDGTTYTYTQTVNDACGRSSTCIQVFTIDNTCKLIDFDALSSGTVVSNQFQGVHISTQDNHNFPAMIFDSENPTGNDFDIGTPNEMYGGPGIGQGFCNDKPQGNVLIISKDADVPNETEGMLIFEFDCAVLIRSIDFIDMECGHNTVSFYDRDHHLISQIDLPQFGENSFHTETFEIGGVYKMVVDFPCAGGAIHDIKYCEDMTPGSMCGLCESATLDFSDHGVDWNHDDMAGNYTVGYQTFDIDVADPDNIFVDSEEDLAGIQVGIDPHDVNDVLPITYNLSETSNTVIFDIEDLDFKDNASKQQEQVCICGFLNGSATPIYPDIVSLDGSVVVDGNCAYGTANSSVSLKDESILVSFKDCIDQVVIKYGTGPHSPTHDPTYSKIIVGKRYGFKTETCPGECEPCGLIGDSDGDGVCDDCDICLSGDDNIDSDGDGLPDSCDGECIDSLSGGDDDGDGVCNVDDVCPGGNDNIDLDGNGVPDSCEECADYKLVFGCSNEWVDNATSGVYTVQEQEFDINIMDMDNILVDTKQDGFGLNVGIDPHDNDDVVLIKYNLTAVANSVMFDIVDLDYKDGNSKQQEAVCVYGFLADSDVKILPAITSLDGSVSINGNCAEGTVNSSNSGQDESVMVVFSECVDQIVIEYGTGTNSPTHDPSYSNITIGLDLGFKTEVCEDKCVTCEEIIMLVGNASGVHYKASEEIGSVQKIQGQEVIYDAGNQIIMYPDFEVVQGTQFSVLLEGCDN